MAIKKLQAGFTLIEMLVVIAIVAVVATVLLFNYSNFSTGIAVRDLAEEIGLSVRKAQSYATSVRSIAGTSGITSNMFPAYGITFSLNTNDGALSYMPNPTNFVLFSDVSPDASKQTNNQYDNDGNCGNPMQGSECLESFGITSGNKIISMQTSLSDIPMTSGTVNVVFHRPDPDAVICVINDGQVDGTCQLAAYVYITVQSPKGTTHVIKMYDTGQIAVE